MLFNYKKHLMWLPAAALILAAGIGYSCSFHAGSDGAQAYRLPVSEISEETADGQDAAVSVDSEEHASGGEASAGFSGGQEQASGEAASALEADPALETSSASVIWVHVCGSVRSEGVYSLPEGSRVKDAIDAAGGFAEDADRSYLNLAAIVADATKVYVPAEGEATASDLLYGSGSSASQEIIIASQPAGNGAAETKVDINKASVQELMSLPGIGRAKAEAIFSYREEHGFFSSPEEIKKVSGIGDGIYKKLESRIKTGG